MTDCGTYSGYLMHARRGETPCTECREANAKYMREYRAARPSVKRLNTLRATVRARALSKLAEAHPQEYRALRAVEAAKVPELTELSRRPKPATKERGPAMANNRKAINAIRKALSEPDDMFDDNTTIRVTFPDGAVDKILHKRGDGDWVSVDLVESEILLLNFEEVMALVRGAARRVEVAHLWKPLIPAE